MAECCWSTLMTKTALQVESRLSFNMKDTKLPWHGANTGVNAPFRLRDWMKWTQVNEATKIYPKMISGVGWSWNLVSSEWVITHVIMKLQAVCFLTDPNKGNVKLTNFCGLTIILNHPMSLVMFRLRE